MIRLMTLALAVAVPVGAALAVIRLTDGVNRLRSRSRGSARDVKRRGE